MGKAFSVFTVILGGVIMWFTDYVATQTDAAPALNLFYYAGIIFVAYGVFTLLKAFITSKDPERGDLETVNEQKQEIIACPKCGTRHYSTSNYCHICGTKLIK